MADGDFERLRGEPFVTDIGGGRGNRVLAGLAGPDDVLQNQR